MPKPRLAVLSHVMPLPRNSGQKQRIFHTLRAAREQFHLTFITVAHATAVEETRRALLTVCDDAIVLASRYSGSKAVKLAHRMRGALSSLRTGLLFSNYLIGDVELSPERMRAVLAKHEFDLALFEYWHAYRATEVFQQAGIPCVLDMHDILWMARTQRLNENTRLPSWIRDRAIRKYRASEESAWRRFDALIAINQAELALTKATVPNRRVFYCPMGVDVAQWAYSWEPVPAAPRIAYYGDLGSGYNQQAALRTFSEVMPRVWAANPAAELWLVGRNPSEALRALTADPRVKVPGYLEDVRPTLRTMTTVVCPWRGRYGFRSRLIEVMALGVPVVSSVDGVHGMGLEHGRGLLLGDTSDELAAHTARLVTDHAFATEQSRAARDVVVEAFNMDGTYRKLMNELDDWRARS